MENMTVVAVDAMGGDNAPVEIVKGAVDAVLNLYAIDRAVSLAQFVTGFEYSNL